MKDATDATLIVQTGDFAEAFDRFAAGGGETFRDQRRSVRYVEAAARDRPVTVACVASDAYDRTLAPGLRAIGLRPEAFHAPGAGDALLERAPAARLLLRAPIASVLDAATRAGLPTFACLADLMRPVTAGDLATVEGWRRWRRMRRLRRLLARPEVVAVGNNGRRAALSLETVLDVPRSRILLHEHGQVPLDPPDPDRVRDGLLFVGVVSEGKGVGDLLEALARSSTRAALRLIGEGPERPALEARAATLGLGERVRFLGRQQGEAVREAMRGALAVVVPSRHSYDEGMPNVIAETLAARTPLVVSDHPAFAGAFRDGETAVVARASDPSDLARALDRVAEDAGLRRRLGDAAPAALEGIDVGHRIYDLWDAFLADDRDRTGWVARLSLAGEGARWV